MCYKRTVIVLSIVSGVSVLSIVISISNLIIVIFVSSSFVSYVCKYRNFVSFGMCAALKKKKKKKKKKYDKRFNFINMFLFHFVGFVQVNNLKQTLNRRIFTVHRFSIIILKFLGSCYVDSL